LLIAASGLQCVPSAWGRPPVGGGFPVASTGGTKEPRSVRRIRGPGTSPVAPFDVASARAGPQTPSSVRRGRQRIHMFATVAWLMTGTWWGTRAVDVKWIALGVGRARADGVTP